MSKIKELFEGIKGGWNNLDNKKKITLIITIVVLLLSITLIAIFSQKVTYITLFNELNPEDAGIIVNDLENKKIKYNLEDQGQKILIDEKHIDNYRLQLAMDGNMPENSTGFEMFDDVSLMATDEDRKIMYQRALTGELEKSIMSLDAINNAKVHLVMSEKSIFETHASDASASVIVDLNPEYKITNDMIMGIAALVAGAVENLPEKNIQIIDSKGNVLSTILREDTVNSKSLVNEYQGLKEEFEYEIEANLSDLLGTIFGRDKIKVMVYADLDFDSEEKTIIRYEDPVIRSEQIEVSGDDISTQDVTGGNIGDNTSNVIDSVTGENSSYNRTTNNELTTENTSTIKAPGKVNRITTSVVYDGEISDERSMQIYNVVASAVGYDDNRGDSINIEGIEFDRSYQDRLAAELEEERLEAERNQGLLKKFYSKHKSIINIVLLALAVILVLALIVRRALIKRKEEKEVLEQMLFAEAQAKEQYAATYEKERKVDNEEIKKANLQAGNNEKVAKGYAQQHPDIAADLIKAWIKSN